MVTPGQELAIQTRDSPITVVSTKSNSAVSQEELVINHVDDMGLRLPPAPSLPTSDHPAMVETQTPALLASPIAAPVVNTSSTSTLGSPQMPAEAPGNVPSTESRTPLPAAVNTASILRQADTGTPADTATPSTGSSEPALAVPVDSTRGNCAKSSGVVGTTLQDTIFRQIAARLGAFLEKNT
ncbi:hypothetical protein CPC08DRAFT_821220 [Agrocybe pediades]|nr:hypothetical protein CPC08DRAFT_821220 [Agrocybe pediades]